MLNRPRHVPRDAARADLAPPRVCAATWREAALGALPAVDLMLLVGRHAQAWHLGPANGTTLTETVRAWRRHATSGLLPLPLPSWRNNVWLRRNPWFATEVLPWLRRQVAVRLARPAPASWSGTART